ncbi:hypothetical protein LguiA_008339 [Lonicera macranthoides]
MEEEVNVEESDYEEYKTEDDALIVEDTDLGTSTLFKDPNMMNTEHVNYTLISELGNTKEVETQLQSLKNQLTPIAIVFSTKSGNITPISPSHSNLCMHISNSHNRDSTDNGDERVADPKLNLHSGNEANDISQLNDCQSEFEIPFNPSTEHARVNEAGLINTLGKGESGKGSSGSVDE